MTEFFRHYIMATMISSVFILLVLLVKRGMKRYISARWQYNISILSLVLLVTPLIPLRWFNALGWRYWHDNGRFLRLPALDHSPIMPQQALALDMESGWLQDFAVSVERTDLSRLTPVLMIVWFAGMAAVSLIMFKCSRDLSMMKASAVTAGEGRLGHLFTQCKAELNIRQNIFCGTSAIVRSPLTVGFYRNLIILPAGIEEELAEEDIRYILLHELTHCKYKDSFLNYIMCVLQTIYWYHPLVRVLLKRMRLEREIACDTSVLSRLPEENHLDYGKTLLHFARSGSGVLRPSFVMQLGGSKEFVRKRLEQIASFRPESVGRRIKSICAFVLAIAVIAGQLPLLSALADVGEDRYEFRGERVCYEDLSRFFEGQEGSFVLYHLETGEYTIHNRQGSTKRISPASTYKIYSALIAMDQGIVSDTDSIRQWDGTDYPFASWNQDQDLKSAMQNSVTWYFQKLDKQTGRRTLESYYRALSYGNQDLSGGIDRYWMESSLRISPVEQVELLTRVYQNQTPFSAAHVDTVKKLLYLSEQDGAVLSGKTGSGAVNGKGVTGWFIGYVETNGQTFLFAANIEGEDGVAGSTAARITQKILKEKGIYQ